MTTQELNQERSKTELTKLYEKIQKLLALQNSPNENEAALAAQRVQELLLKYNLSMAEVDGHTTQEAIAVEEISKMPGNRKYHWCGMLANVVGEVNCCKIFWSGATLCAIGRPTNIRVTRDLYTYLATTVERIADQEWRAWKKRANPSGGESTRWYNSFVDGCVGRLYYRLKEQLQNQEANGVSDEECTTSAIVVKSFYEKESAAIQEWQESNIGQFREGGRSQSKTNFEGYYAGAAAGDKISLAKQIEAEGDRKMLA